MRSLMPAEAPAAFWRTEYYASMAEVMEAYDEESECPVVRERSEFDNCTESAHASRESFSSRRKNLI